MQPIATCHATSVTRGNGIGSRLESTVPKANRPAAVSARAMPGRLAAARLRPARSDQDDNAADTQGDRRDLSWGRPVAQHRPRQQCRPDRASCRPVSRPAPQEAIAWRPL